VKFANLILLRMSAQPEITIITPNRNGERFLKRCIESVLQQREEGVNLEYIIMDGGSSDQSLKIVESFGASINQVVSEKDRGPASAINKGFRIARGQCVGWLNADDFYYPGALKRIRDAFLRYPDKALCFGHCPIVNEEEVEIRKGITRFKEAFYPVSSRFTIQCINYISQPATMFRRDAVLKAGLLREDLKAAWDYEYILRLWRQGGAFCLPNPPLAAFRWHGGSISGRHFKLQFKEEYDAALADAGRFTPQALIHWLVRWGIVGAYSVMAHQRKNKSPL